MTAPCWRTTSGGWQEARERELRRARRVRRSRRTTPPALQLADRHTDAVQRTGTGLTWEAAVTVAASSVMAAALRASLSEACAARAAATSPCACTGREACTWEAEHTPSARTYLEGGDRGKRVGQLPFQVSDQCGLREQRSADTRAQRGWPAPRPQHRRRLLTCASLDACASRSTASSCASEVPRRAAVSCSSPAMEADPRVATRSCRQAGRQAAAGVQVVASNPTQGQGNSRQKKPRTSSFRPA